MTGAEASARANAGTLAAAMLTPAPLLAEIGFYLDALLVGRCELEALHTHIATRLRPWKKAR